MPADLAAILFCALIGLLCVFQLALAFGAPLGHFAWGGAHRRLPAGMRIASLVSLVIYALLAAVALQRAGLVQIFDPGLAAPLMWGIAAFLGLGVLMNAITRSKAERYTMTPLALALCALAVVIAMSPMAGSTTPEVG